MRIAVTGAGGFIGSALTQMLAGEGHEVLPLSRNALSGPDLSGVETVVHCAALAHRTGAERPDAATFDAVNHRLAVELAARAKAAGVKRFVFVSTIYTVAGNPSPLTPDMPLKPRDDYGRAKARAETRSAGTKRDRDRHRTSGSGLWPESAGEPESADKALRQRIAAAFRSGKQPAQLCVAGECRARADISKRCACAKGCRARVSPC
ncbi:NAD-dependent epimerase/dehydratase [Brucella intermedia LMG 3301]|uniref:NAD-dependent epimerase/dehydratase n=1 Tax=Brucella intermedia LMG 3301 TaxID=641118 RepID=C4WEA7_9HYPH|nr:NAD-dependent epimerase/dehydratase [Brucella intermedia LMG 3301]